MPLIVPVLRLAMLFLNVYDTYKTLKPPPPSSRNGGRPSARATTQRKRDMKGCLAIWIVWCYYASYERSFDGIIGLFIPFYGELKSVLLLFLILTRSKGAEPIYLHIIRPMLKPYTTTVDSILDVVFMFGDIAFVLAAWPFNIAWEYWNEMEMDSLWYVFRREQAPTPEDDHEAPAIAAPQPLPPPPVFPEPAPTNAINPAQTTRPSGPTTRARRNATQIPVGGRAALRPVSKAQIRPRASRSINNGHRHLQRPLSSNSNASAKSGQEIWHPPASAYEEAALEAPVPSQSPAFSEDQVTRPSTPPPAPVVQVEEWRLYPAFPSAYPPTPIHVQPITLPLPAPPQIVAPQPQLAAGAVQFPTIEEHTEEIEEEQEEEKKEEEHTSDEVSTEPHSEPTNEDAVMEGSATGSLIINTDQDDGDRTDTMDEEDDFDVTLRTPLTLRSRTDSSATTSSTSTSVSSAPSSSTALTTIGGASSLRTRTNSGSSTSMSDASDSSIIGRKRERPRLPYERVWEGHTVIGVKPSMSGSSRNSSTKTDNEKLGSNRLIESEDEEVHDERFVPGIKRRRTTQATIGRGSRIRPVAEIAARRANLATTTTNTKNPAPVRTSSRLAHLHANNLPRGPVSAPSMKRSATVPSRGKTATNRK